LLNSGLLVVLGGLLALALDLPAIAIAALAAVLGVLRGAANLDGLPAAEDAVLVTSGILVSGYAVATLAAAVTLAFRRSGAPWRAAIVRAAGVGVAGVGCALAAFA
jgi:hydrogenase/urease accessory protein HupE